MKEEIFTKFKVWDMQKLTENECRDVAIDHFNDICETFDLGPETYMHMYHVETPPNGQKIYCYKIVNGYLPIGA